ncbi:MAG: methionyl-tRNA formyltransferase [Steroidobacteraceae bacterium]
MRVVFAGTPAFALPPLAALHAQHTLVGVLTQPDRPAGRGRVLTASPVKQAAQELGVPVWQPQRLRGAANEQDAALGWLRGLQPDVIVVVAYGLILPAAVLQLPRLGCLNIHASLLPRWRGAAPIQRAILAGDAETGVCIMQMDEGLDTGAVLSEARLAIGIETTSAQLHDHLAELGAVQILRALNELNEGRARATLQPSQGVTYAEKLSKAEARVNWHHDAEQIDRQIRAFNPWPVAETTMGGEAVKLLRSRVPVQASPGSVTTPGTVAGLHDDALHVACGRGVVHVLELQRAGRKPVTAREFMNAARNADGAALVFQ